MSSEYTQQTFFSTLSILYKGKYHLAHFGNPFHGRGKKKKEKRNLTKTFLMANASGSLHDAYESAY